MTPLDWIREASEPSRTYRKMVVGWQNSVFALNALVRAFNSEYLRSEDEKVGDMHHMMREIAVKKIVNASLFELKPQIDAWFRCLKEEGVLSGATIEKKKAVKHLIAQVEKFDGIRNATFHYGDVNEPTEDMIRLYEEIQSVDLAVLQRILEELIDVGQMLRDDAYLKAL